MKRTSPAPRPDHGDPASASRLGPGHDNDNDGIDKAKAGPRSTSGCSAAPIGNKATACFVRRYDASHLAQHPKQKVAVDEAAGDGGEPPEGADQLCLQGRRPVPQQAGQFRRRQHLQPHGRRDGKQEISFSCDVECGGGGLEVAMAKDDKSAIVNLEVIGVYDRKHPDARCRDAGRRHGRQGVPPRSRRHMPNARSLTGHKEVASLQRK